MEELGLARTTVHRILGALETAGFVTSGRSRGRFRLGPEIARLAEAARHTLILDLRPYLEQLSRTLNETVDLSVLEYDQVLFMLPDPLPALTPNTITRRERMIAELAEVRAAGVAFDREEHTVGISAVGSVVAGSPWGTVAISVPMPTQRFAGRESDLAATLTEMTLRIEATFNGSPG
jgi:DNA-binding IclR family transcriptional regulator